VGEFFNQPESETNCGRLATSATPEKHASLNNVFFASAGYVVARLTGYAYETIPNKSITTGQTKGPDNNSIDEPIASLAAPTPQPASLGMLALGASTLSIWRREESMEDTPKRWVVGM
jgi:hypothetical protein